MAVKEKEPPAARDTDPLEQRLDRLEAKLDQVLADGKAVQSALGDLKDWVKRMVRLVKGQ